MYAAAAFARALSKEREIEGLKKNDKKHRRVVSGVFYVVTWLLCSVLLKKIKADYSAAYAAYSDVIHQ